FVRILEGLTSRNLRGEFNIAGPEGIDRWNFGRRIAAVMGLDPNIIRRVGSDEFPSLARRPADTTFDTDKVSSLGLKPTPLDESIELSVQQMEALA
ncbi:MAG: sugar nucleotide-binding protein, partial [Leptospiraceae bacterium]|nr:sugar nucleotide-binding protein [Leptospiraceae bacterium]